ncbi:hypothetical protein KY284_007081 [Solanum tuberosum]|nr:hypothetical protein KY284_007081 [Solanum tuberosum]
MITPVDDQSRRAIDTMDANMLAELLQQVLESSRYFIVLVDIPDIVTWRALNRNVISGRVLHPALPLSQIAKDIVEKCNGLPLMILVIAGALSTKKTDSWELFYVSLVDKVVIAKTIKLKSNSTSC